MDINASVDINRLDSKIDNTNDITYSPKNKILIGNADDNRLFSHLDNDGIYEEDGDDEDIDINIQSFSSSNRAQSAPNYGNRTNLADSSNTFDSIKIDSVESINSVNAPRAKSASSTTRRKLGVSTNKQIDRVMDIDHIAAMNINTESNYDDIDVSNDDNINVNNEVISSPKVKAPKSPLASNNNLSPKPLIQKTPPYSPDNNNGTPSPSKSHTPFSSDTFKSEKSINSAFADKIKSIVESEKNNTLPYSPTPKSRPHTQLLTEEEINEDKHQHTNEGDELRNLASPITVENEKNNDILVDNIVVNKNPTKKVKGINDTNNHLGTYNTYINDNDIKTVEKAKSSSLSSATRKKTNSNYNLALKAFDIAETNNSNKKNGRWK
jgi:hypothetical protein